MPPLWTPSCDSTRDCGLRAYGSQTGASEVQKQACIFACLFVPWMLTWVCLFFKAPRVPYGQASSLLTWVETVFVFNTFIATWQTVKCGFVDCKKHRSFSAFLSLRDISPEWTEHRDWLLTVSMCPPSGAPAFGGTVLLQLVSVTFQTEGRVLKCARTNPCPLVALDKAVNALVCLRINRQEKGAGTELSPDTISARNKTLWSQYFRQKGAFAPFAKAWDPIIRSQRKMRQERVWDPKPLSVRPACGKWGLVWKFSFLSLA